MIAPFFKKIFLPKAYQSVSSEIISTAWQGIQFKSDHRLINGRIWKQTDSALGWVILIHPYHEMGKDYFLATPHSELYYNWGYHLVIFDLNGFGSSPDYDFSFEKDLLAVSRELKNIDPSLPIIAHGISFGAAILLKTLTRNHQIQKAIIENCMDEVRNYYKLRSKSLYFSVRISEKISSFIRNQNTFYRFAEKIKGISKIILIYTEQDDLTTPEMGHKIASHCAVPVSYHLLQGGHMEAVTTDAEKYRAIIAEYLQSGGG